jgi:8-oxo-dGTP pyrophosphatase MutT (NUDIX family)
MDRMIRFDAGPPDDPWRFNYRIVGVCIDAGRVLVHQAPGDPFWTLPGGRAELGESASQTLAREMQEELGLGVTVGRPLWLVENFFELDGRRYHEIALYFSMTLPEDAALLRATEPFSGREADTLLWFRWVEIDPAILAALPLLPALLHTRLVAPPVALEHLVEGTPAR